MAESSEVLRSPKWCVRASIRNRPCLFAPLVLIGAVAVLSSSSCESRSRAARAVLAAQAEAEAAEKIPADLPVVELPAIDLAKEVPSVEEEKSPQALGRTISSGKFVVRFEARRPSDMERPPPRGVFFYVYYRSKTGKLLGQSCFVKPTIDKETGKVVYQGVCEERAYKGEALIAVRIQGKTHLVRSTRVE